MNGEARVHEGSLVFLNCDRPESEILESDWRATLDAVFGAETIHELTPAYREILAVDIAGVLLESPSEYSLESAFYEAACELRRRIGGTVNLTPYLDSLAVGYCEGYQSPATLTGRDGGTFRLRFDRTAEVYLLSSEGFPMDERWASCRTMDEARRQANEWSYLDFVTATLEEED